MRSARVRIDPSKVDGGGGRSGAVVQLTRQGEATFVGTDCLLEIADVFIEGGKLAKAFYFQPFVTDSSRNRQSILDSLSCLTAITEARQDPAEQEGRRSFSGRIA